MCLSLSACFDSLNEHLNYEEAKALAFIRRESMQPNLLLSLLGKEFVKGNLWVFLSMAYPRNNQTNDEEAEQFHACIPE